MVTNHVSAEDVRLCMAYVLNRMYGCPELEESGVPDAFERVLTATSTYGACPEEGGCENPCFHNQKEIARLAEAKALEDRHHGAR